MAEALVLCFEANGDVNIESVAGSFLSIPSEDIMHAEAQHDSGASTYHAGPSHHSDLAFSAACSKEQRTTQFDQERALNFLDGILYSKVEDLPQSRTFQLVSYAPPLIEDAITASLTTVVRILYN